MIQVAVSKEGEGWGKSVRVFEIFDLFYVVTVRTYVVLTHAKNNIKSTNEWLLTEPIIRLPQTRRQAPHLLPAKPSQGRSRL